VFMDRPAWLVEARKHIGLQEIPGKKTTPVIARWLRELRAWWTDDETPWCGVFVAACVEAAGIKKPKNWFRAKAWLEFGTSIETPVPGCIAVFERRGGGHVGFVVGVDERRRLMVLGGNQGNTVSIAPFHRYRVLGYRWPEVGEVPSGVLPLIASNGAEASINEA
jgi:uncharacterized protein (TIGR02594 family)